MAIKLKRTEIVDFSKSRPIHQKKEYILCQNQVFRQIVCYLAELFRQIVCYLAELFRQIVCYLAELFRQIAFPKKNRKYMLI